MATVKERLKNLLMDLEKDDLKQFQWYLRNNEGIAKRELENADVLDTVDKMVERFGPAEALTVTVKTLRKMNQNLLADELEHTCTGGSMMEVSRAGLCDYRQLSLRLKRKLREDYERILVGNSETGHREYLMDIYTDLYVVKNETGGFLKEHEVRQIESNLSRCAGQETAIKSNGLFKVHSDTGRRNRKVLTMGIAGVGKTISVSKFILDWVEGRENQDILFLFPLPFCRLNMIKEEHSLMGLLNKCFFSGPEELTSLPEGDGEVMFIFDGLDECRFPLRFCESDELKDVCEKATVSKIITNLFARHLVSSALIWITSRPAAAGLIPRDYTDLVTEVRGFDGEQRELYFRRNGSPEVAENIIHHIRKSKSLFIMCHIPIFCWILLTVLQPLLARKSNVNIPTTLTEMYTCFLLSQKQRMKAKYASTNGTSFDQIILKLGKLAFEQLEKGNLIFYTEDLEECGLDVDDGSVYSGLCTQIFQVERAVSEIKVYGFVHLSVQEFLAALYVFFKHRCSGENPFFQSWSDRLRGIFYRTSLLDLHKAAINTALSSENGHLDLFLRFLLGLSLESNHSDLKELLPGLNLQPESVTDTVVYIKAIIKKEQSVERTINLYHCLSELKDYFEEDLLKNLHRGTLSTQKLSSSQVGTLEDLLAKMIQSLGDTLDEKIKVMPEFKSLR